MLIIICFFLFFFFKQKTAYEMRISDWSSDVCSSDLGNHTIHTDPGILICPKKAGNERGMRVRRWPVEEILARGYGVATAWYGDIQPELPDTFKEGVNQLFFKPGQRKPDPGEWGAIGAWEWGLSGAMDSLEQDKDVNYRTGA